MRGIYAAIVALPVALCASDALAQLDDDPILPPTVGDPPLRIEPTIVAPLPVAGVGSVLPGAPTPKDAIPGLMGEDIAVPLGRLLPEGAFLVQRLGGLVRATTGEWVFVSAADDSGLREPPVVLLPSATLDDLEHEIGTENAGVRVLLSGQVLVYHGRNYLLPTMFSVTREQPTPDDPPTPLDVDSGDVPTGETENPPTRRIESDPRVEALLDQLEAEGRRTAELDIPARPTTDAERGEALLHDGRLSIRERGRVTRLANGRLAFSFDQDQEQARPLVLLPSSTLAAIELAIARTGEAQAVILSGRQYVHRAQRYMLPISFTLVPESDLKPIQ